MKHIPNLITTLRLILAFVFVYLFTTEYHAAALIVFAIAAISDAFDGWFARKMRIVSKFGEHFDPLADKILTISAFVSFATLDIVPIWCVAIIIVRDVVTTALRYLFFTKRHILTSKSAKLKTLLQLVFIAFVLTVQLLEAQDILYSDGMLMAIVIVATLTLWTMIEYIVLVLKK